MLSAVRPARMTFAALGKLIFCFAVLLVPENHGVRATDFTFELLDSNGSLRSDEVAADPDPRTEAPFVVDATCSLNHRGSFVTDCCVGGDLVETDGLGWPLLLGPDSTTWFPDSANLRKAPIPRKEDEHDSLYTAQVQVAQLVQPVHEFFDDFSYEIPGDLERHGWEIAERVGGPGPEGARFTKETISLVTYLDDPSNRILRVVAATSGTAESCLQAEISTASFFLKGTYAARVRFSDTPRESKDSTVQAFFSISPWAEDTWDYSECDFEYLAYDDWAWACDFQGIPFCVTNPFACLANGPGLYLSTWGFVPKPWPQGCGALNPYRQVDRDNGTLAAWHTLLFWIADGAVEYSVDGMQVAYHAGSSLPKFYPNTPMVIAFQHWYSGFDSSPTLRGAAMDVDWVYHAKDVSLSCDEVETVVEQFRSQDIPRRDTMQEDTTSPLPDPMTWATEPHATGQTSIRMVATIAQDPSGVEYYFKEYSGNPGGSHSGWQDSPEYIDASLEPSMTYQYRVRARDKSSRQNTTGWSGLRSATTYEEEDTTPPLPNPMAWSMEPYATGQTSIRMVAETAYDPHGVEYYFAETSGNPGGMDSDWQDGPTYENWGLEPGVTYKYKVRARDKSSRQNATGYSSLKSAKTDEVPNSCTIDPYEVEDVWHTTCQGLPFGADVNVMIANVPVNLTVTTEYTTADQVVVGLPAGFVSGLDSWNLAQLILIVRTCADMTGIFGAEVQAAVDDAFPGSITGPVVDIHLLGLLDDYTEVEIDSFDMPVTLRIPVDDITANNQIVFAESDLDTSYAAFLPEGTIFEQFASGVAEEEGLAVIEVDDFRVYVPRIIMGAPAIGSVVPATGSEAGGTNAIVFGSGFQAGAAVDIGGGPATIMSLDNTSIGTITGPLPVYGDTAVDVVVSNPDGLFDVLVGGFTYLAESPTILDIDPTEGALVGGDTVTLLGEFFDDDARVLFGPNESGSVTFISGNELTVVTPPGDQTGTVHVAVLNRSSQISDIIPNGFTYISPLHEVSKPGGPSGPGSGDVGEVLTYVVTLPDAECSRGHAVQYRFDWDDENYSSWGSSKTASHAWQSCGVYYPKVQARCSVDHSVVSQKANGKKVEIPCQCAMSAPSRPSGPTQLCGTASGSYSTSGGSCSCGHPLHSSPYKFDWGDGSQTSWTTSPQSHSYSSAGTYMVRAKARCSQGHESGWSSGLTVQVTAHTVSKPGGPSGPGCGDVGEELTYVVTAPDALCSCGHAVQYRIEWDDGSYSNWSSTKSASHSWQDAGTYYPEVQARCSADHSVVSQKANGKTVRIPCPCTMSAPALPDGPIELAVGESGSYSTSGGSCSCGHPLDPTPYMFSWGDGIETRTDWTTSPQSHSYSSVGTYDVKAKARCSQGHESGWSQALTVHVGVDTKVLSVSRTGIYPDESGGTYSFDIQNTGSGTMSWTVSESCSWVSLSPTSGTNDGTVYVTVSSYGVVDGYRTCTITITAPGAQGSPKTLTVGQYGPFPPPWQGGVYLKNSLKEEVLPARACGEERLAIRVSPFSELALRLTADETIDPDSVWATVQAEGWYVEEAVWRPTDPNDGSDGWVVFSPVESMPTHSVVTMSAGALTVDGEIVGPVSAEFSVGVQKQGSFADHTPSVEVEANIDPLAELLAAPASEAYRIGPVGVFMEPVTVQIPVPRGSNVEELDIYYFSESPEHEGWYLGENVIGWMVPESRVTVEEDGQTYIQIEVNHSGVLQLGRAIKVELGSVATLDVGVSGSRDQWLSVVGTLVLLSVVFAALRKRHTARI